MIIMIIVIVVMMDVIVIMVIIMITWDGPRLSSRDASGRCVPPSVYI